MSESEQKNRVQAEVVGMIQQILNTDMDLAEDTPLGEVGLDSMKIIQLISQFEKKYGIEFDDDDLVVENFVSTGKIVDLLTKRYQVGA